MKLMLAALPVLFASIVAQAAPSTFGVKCEGLVKTEGQPDRKIFLRTSADLQNLEMAIVPASSIGEPVYFQSFPVVSSQLMFPIAGIKASRDQRPADGDLTTLKLGIYNEIRTPHQLYPSNLTVESTYYDRRGGGEKTEVKKYKLQCEFL